MTDEDVKPTPLRHHLLFSGLIIGLMAIIAIFFTRYPMTCQIGYTLTSGGGSTVCVRSGTAK